MDAKLVIVSGASKAAEFKLKLPTVIGRSRSVDLPLGHSLVSRQHCELFEEGGVLKLRDLGSLNGTFVGEDRITDAVVLQPGTQFTVGPVTFRADYGAAPANDLLDNSDFSATAVLPPRAGAALRPLGAEASAMASLETVPAPAPSEIKPGHSAPPGAQTPSAGSPSAGDADQGADDDLDLNLDPGIPDLLPGDSDAEELRDADNLNEFLPTSPEGGAGGFDWLVDSNEPAPQDTVFGLNENPAATSPEDVSAGEDEAAAPSKNPRGKPSKPNPAFSLFKKGDAKKPAPPKTSSKSTPPTPEPAPNAAAPPEELGGDDEQAFPLPEPGHPAGAADSGLKNSLDFLE